MSLHMKLMVNGQQIGHLEIRRREPGRQTGNNVCHYDWRININGKTGWNLEDQPVAHRYGDGAWALVARVVEAAGYGPAAPSSAPETDREAALEAEARFWAAQDNDWRTEPAGRHVPAVQRWMALDLATALQGASTAGIAERRIAEVGWAQTWAELLAAVRATGAGHCGHDLEAFEALGDASEAHPNPYRAASVMPHYPRIAAERTVVEAAKAWRAARPGPWTSGADVEFGLLCAVDALGDVGADPDGEQKIATTPDPDPGD